MLFWVCSADEKEMMPKGFKNANLRQTVALDLTDLVFLRRVRSGNKSSCKTLSDAEAAFLLG